MSSYFKKYFKLPRPYYWSPKEYDSLKINRIIIFSEGDKIGDSLCTIPFLKTLKKSFSNAKVTYICKYQTAWKDILKEESKLFFDDIHPFVNMKKLSEFGFFDLVIDLNQRVKTTIELLKIPHKYFVSNTYGGIFGNFKTIYSVKKIHRVSRNMLLLYKLGIKYNDMIFDSSLEIPIEIKNEVGAKYFLNDAICLMPGSGDRRKCWDLSNYIELAKKVLLENKKIVAIFGPQDNDMYEIFYNEFKNNIYFPLQENSQWLSSIYYTMSICSMSKLCIGNDGGISHIASSGGARVLGLYGRIHPRKTAMIGRHHEIIYKGKDINEITPKEVKTKIKEMINY